MHCGSNETSEGTVGGDAIGGVVRSVLMSLVEWNARCECGGSLSRGEISYNLLFCQGSIWLLCRI